MGYNSVCVRDIFEIFASIGGFRGWVIECCHSHFSPPDPRCHGNKIWDKMGYNSVCVRDICEIYLRRAALAYCLICLPDTTLSNDVPAAGANSRMSKYLHSKKQLMHCLLYLLCCGLFVFSTSVLDRFSLRVLKARRPYRTELNWHGLVFDEVNNKQTHWSLVDAYVPVVM